MTYPHCACHDPVVFGHHPYREQPPTYKTGETFTITSPAQMWIQNENGQPQLIGVTEHLTLHADRIAAGLRHSSWAMETLTQSVTTAHEALQTVHNHLEPRQTHPYYAELWGTGEPCA